MNQPTENPCQLCNRTHPDTTHLCHRCLDHLKHDLKATPDLLLDIATNGICYDYVDKHASGYITFTPADVNQISLLDPRSGITRVLRDWAHTVRTALNLTINPNNLTITELVNRHIGWLPWLATHSDAAMYAQDVQTHVKQLRHARDGKPRRIPLGACPVINEDTNERCNNQLSADLTNDIIRCNKCRTSWTTTAWQLLGRAISA